MRFAVVVFPGSNCERDCFHVIDKVLGEPVEYVWHKETSLPDGTDCVILPGGFSYGDYLRPGAIAKFSPISKAVIDFANKGGYVMGICNGFQVLTELGLLEGVLLKNTSLKFICETVPVRVATNNTAFTSLLNVGDVLHIPIAHNEGNYFAPQDTITRLFDEDRVVLQYCTEDGKITNEANPNGSVANIAGIVNTGRNVFGLMPHPERASEDVLGLSEGVKIFKSLIDGDVR